MRSLSTAILISLAACSTPAGPQHFDVEPLHALQTVEFDYRGALSSHGLPEGQYVPSRVKSPDRMVDVRVEVLALDQDALPAIMSEGQVWLRADRVERAAATQVLSRLIEEGRADWLFNPRMQFYRGATTQMSVANSISYVDSISIEPFGDSALGDPHVAICRDGFLAQVSVPEEGDAGSCQVHLKMGMAELQRPMASTPSKLPGNEVSLTIQTPIFATQELEVDVLLTSEDLLIIGPLPAFSGSRPMIVVLHADPVAPPIEEQ